MKVGTPVTPGLGLLLLLLLLLFFIPPVVKNIYIAHYHSRQGLKVISDALGALWPWIKQEMITNAKKSNISVTIVLVH